MSYVSYMCIHSLRIMNGISQQMCLERRTLVMYVVPLTLCDRKWTEIEGQNNM